jgi:hypothetical protein
MSTKKNKSNLKDTSAEKFSEVVSKVSIGLDVVNSDKVTMDDIDHTDPDQIDLEDQIEEEREYKVRFKDENKKISLSGHANPITSDNLDEVTKTFLIDSELCVEGDFV